MLARLDLETLLTARYRSVHCMFLFKTHYPVGEKGIGFYLFCISELGGRYRGILDT